MSRSQLLGPSHLRVVLAAVVVVDLLSFFFFVGEVRESALANGIALNAFNDLLSSTAARALLVLIGVGGAIAFGRSPGRLWAGMFPLGALVLLSTVHAQLFGSPWRHLFYSGLCLSGWLLGLAASRRRGMPTSESYARTGSLALLGAAYLNAGISKLVYGGFDWISGTPIQAVIIGQDGLVADSILSTYRSWVVTTPAVASLFSLATLGFELAGPLMIAGRRIRPFVALGLFAMHANIYVLTDILYWESMVFLLVFGLSREATDPQTAPESVAIRFDERAFAASAAGLTLWALVAITHQGLRYAHARVQPAYAKAAASEPPTDSAPSPQAEQSIPVAPSASPPLSLRQVGPFAVGQTLAEGWSVDSFEITDGGFIAALSGKPGRAAFELTCAPSAHRSPFDLGAAHLFYSSDLPFRDLEAVGRAFREQVQADAAGQDICVRLMSWRTVAQAGQPRSSAIER